jgi:hypothetical protein
VITPHPFTYIKHVACCNSAKFHDQMWMSLVRAFWSMFLMCIKDDSAKTRYIEPLVLLARERIPSLIKGCFCFLLCRIMVASINHKGVRSLSTVPEQSAEPSPVSRIEAACAWRSRLNPYERQNWRCGFFLVNAGVSKDTNSQANGYIVSGAIAR